MDTSYKNTVLFGFQISINKEIHCLLGKINYHLTTTSRQYYPPI